MIICNIDPVVFEIEELTQGHWHDAQKLVPRMPIRDEVFPKALER
jgi:hypothetical protein